MIWILPVVLHYSHVLPHETENAVYRYLIAISKLRLGILTEQGEGACSFFRSSSESGLIYLFIIMMIL